MANTNDKTVQERLAQIAAAVAAKTKTQGTQSVPAMKLSVAGVTCPTDPAERALCDSCQ